MHIMTANGWKLLIPRDFTRPAHTPTLLEQMGITPAYNPVKAFVDYANNQGNGWYFEYYTDGPAVQIRPALHPLRGMLDHTAFPAED